MKKLSFFPFAVFISALVLGLLAAKVATGAGDSQPSFEPAEIHISNVQKSETAAVKNETQLTFPRYGVYGINEPSSRQEQFPDLTLGLTDYDPYLTNQNVSKKDYYVGVLEASREFPQTDNVIQISGQNLSFTTAVVDGVRFTFEGEFSLQAFTKADTIEKPVLAGNLRKFRNGKKVFDDHVEFLFLGD